MPFSCSCLSWSSMAAGRTRTPTLQGSITTYSTSFRSQRAIASAVNLLAWTTVGAARTGKSPAPRVTLGFVSSTDGRPGGEGGSARVGIDVRGDLGAWQECEEIGFP